MNGTAATYTAGRVGIGTTAPNTLLEVRHGGFQVIDDVGQFIYLATNHLTMANGTNEDNFYQFISDGTTENHRFSTEGSPRLRIESGGQIRIGAADPTTVFNIYDGSVSPTLTQFTQGLTRAGMNLQTVFTNNTYTPGLFWSTVNDNPDKPKAGIFMFQSTSGSRLIMGTTDDYATGIRNDVQIDASGRLRANRGFSATSIDAGGPSEIAQLHVGSYVQPDAILAVTGGSTTLPVIDVVGKNGAAANLQAGEGTIAGFTPAGVGGTLMIAGGPGGRGNRNSFPSGGDGGNIVITPGPGGPGDIGPNGQPGRVGVNTTAPASTFHVVGTLTATTKNFTIDHPLDPANKYLVHCSVESDQMANIYRGNVTLDGRGGATVVLPEWFEALNTDYSYQLTAVGAPSPMLHISREITGGSFDIGGGSAGLKVSWIVTGIRRDAFAQANPLEVEQEKPPEARGRYLHPAEHGAPEERGVHPAMVAPGLMLKEKPGQ